MPWTASSIKKSSLLMIWRSSGSSPLKWELILATVDATLILCRLFMKMALKTLFSATIQTEILSLGTFLPVAKSVAFMPTLRSQTNIFVCTQSVLLWKGWRSEERTVLGSLKGWKANYTKAYIGVLTCLYRLMRILLRYSTRGNFGGKNLSFHSSEQGKKLIYILKV